jgi:hypothetical protein
LEEVVAVEQTVEMAAVAVNFDTVLQQVLGYLRLQQNLHSKWARAE